MAFTPFMQSTGAQNIIDSYIDSGGFNQTIANDATRNHLFDLRTEQGLPADALYPNPQIDFSVQEDEIVDPCQEGYMLVDGICQPIEQFGQSSYDEKQSGRTEDDPEGLYLPSDEEIANMTDQEYLDNLISRGWLKNSALGYLPSKGGVLDLKSGAINHPGFAFLFGNLQKAKRDKMLAELNRRGLFYNIGNEQKVVMPDTPIPDNAVQVSNLGFSEAEMAAANAAAIAQQTQAVQDQMNQSIQQSQQMGYGQGGGQPSNMGYDRGGQEAPRDYSTSPGAIFGDMEYDEE
jgi:hypothetical protein